MRRQLTMTVEKHDGETVIYGNDPHEIHEYANSLQRPGWTRVGYVGAL